MANRTKKSVTNIAFSLFSNAIIFILNYVTRLIFVRFLDASYLGINGLFTDVLSLLSLADLGMVSAMMYSLYKPLSDNDEDKITQIINFFKKIYNIIAIVVAVVGIALIPFLKFIVNLENNLDSLYIYYLLFLFETVTSYLFVYRTTLLSADQKNYIVVKWNIVIQIFKFVIRILVLVFFKDYVLYILCGVIVNFTGNLSQNALVFKYYPYLKKPVSRIKNEDKREIYNNVKSTFIYKFCSVIQMNTTTILVSMFVGTIVVGYYSNYMLMINGVVSVLNTLFSSIKSSMGNYIAEGKHDLKKMFDSMELATYLIIAFCSIAFVCLFEDFILISYGEEYKLPIYIVLIIVINFYTSNIRQNIWIFRETSGIFSQTKYLTLVTSTINLILAIILGYFFGLFGILISISISRFVYSFWKEPIILFKNIFKTSSKSYFINYFINLLLLAVICLGTYFICESIVLSNIYLTFIIKIIIVTILPTIMYLFIFMKDKRIFFIREKIQGLLKK